MTQPPTLSYATPHRRKTKWWIAFIIALVLGIGFALVVMLFTARVVTVRIAAPATIATAPPTTPSRFTIPQRQSQPLAGTNGTILAHIGDITGGQVLLTISDATGAQILSTVSMKEGDIQTMVICGTSFEVELIQLRNFLVGDDFAVFEIRKSGTAMSEPEKIKRLIEAVAGAQGIEFIRNGDAHSAKAAADHLQSKLNAVNQPNMTARQFIDEIASRSSISGEEYRVKLPNSVEIPAREWFLDQLHKMNSSTQPAPRP